MSREEEEEEINFEEINNFNYIRACLEVKGQEEQQKQLDRESKNVSIITVQVRFQTSSEKVLQSMELYIYVFYSGWWRVL